MYYIYICFGIVNETTSSCVVSQRWKFPLASRDLRVPFTVTFDPLKRKLNGHYEFKLIPVPAVGT